MRLEGIHHITAITADESLESLGERLSLPPNFEPSASAWSRC